MNLFESTEKKHVDCDNHKGLVLFFRVGQKLSLAV